MIRRIEVINCIELVIENREKFNFLFDSISIKYQILNNCFSINCHLLLSVIKVSIL
jgi:hypothetical protein